MSRQIAVRLPDEIADFVDRQVREGRATSRAAVLAAALDRERRRTIAVRDAEILARTGIDADMDSLARYVQRLPLDDLA